MDSEQQAELLLSGANKWNKWRAESSDLRIILAYRDLSLLNLSGYNLSGASFYKTNFTGANLSNADLQKCDFTDANLSNTNLSHANFTGDNLTSTTVLNADFSNANLLTAKLFYITFEGCKLAGAVFDSSRFYGTNFAGVDLCGVSFRYIKSVGAIKFAGSNLWKTDFKNADLKEADLSNTYILQLPNFDLSKTVFKYLNYVADLSYTNLTNTNLSGANLSEVVFNKALFKHIKTKGTIFSGSFFCDTRFEDVEFKETDFSNAAFVNAFLEKTDFTESIFTGANFCNANLFSANFTRAILCNCNMTLTTLSLSNLEGADLSGADLRESLMIRANVEGAKFNQCKVFGVAAWDLNGIPKEQNGIIITADDEPEITVDDLNVAQFLYLLLNKESLRNILNTITAKSVLILGRFTPERKKILDAIASELRNHNLLPIIFDFEKPILRNYTETIKTLAGLSMFVIVDITNPKSLPLELQAIVPDYQIPFVPIIQEGERPFSMMIDLFKYDWVLSPVVNYSSVENLISNFKEVIIDRAWDKLQDLQVKKAEVIKTQSINDFIKK